MKYFLHDTHALQDDKLTELYMTYGYEGTGLFFAILERLAYHEKPIKTTVLKKQLEVGKKLEKVWSFMETIGLISSENGETFNKTLLKFGEKYEKIKEKNRERQAQHRENQQVPKSVTRDKRVSHDPNSIVGNSNNKKQTKKDGATAPSTLDLFNQFFNAYGKKVDRKKALAKWEKLSADDHKAILVNVPLYVGVHPEWKYRRSPAVYLNNENWKDEIVTTSRVSGAKSGGLVV